MAASTSTSWTRRARPAPIETRSAISRARAAAWEVIKFATFAQATNRTRATNTARAASGLRNSLCAAEIPGAAGSSSTLWFKKLATICSGIPAKSWALSSRKA